MKNFNYSQDTLLKIDKVCKDPAVQILGSFPSDNLFLDKIEELIKSILKFVAENNEHIGTIDYVLKIDLINKLTTTEKLNPVRILKERKSNNILIEINSELHILNTDKFDQLSNSGLSKYSFHEKCLLVFVSNGIDTTMYCKGLVICEINAENPTLEPKINKNTSRGAVDYKQSLIDFYKKRVRLNVTPHWNNPSKRILNGGKTEEIFQLSLANWLNENISAAKIIPKAKKISKDETDIEIHEHGGNVYLIEIKWLGENANKSKNGHSKIKDAINQVINYLDLDTEILEATLVIYDGRKLSEYEKIVCINEEQNNWKEISECLGRKLPTKGKGYVFFLISESASKRIPA